MIVLRLYIFLVTLMASETGNIITSTKPKRMFVTVMSYLDSNKDSYVSKKELLKAYYYQLNFILEIKEYLNPNHNIKHNWVHFVKPVITGCNIQSCSHNCLKKKCTEMCSLYVECVKRSLHDIGYTLHYERELRKKLQDFLGTFDRNDDGCISVNELGSTFSNESLIELYSGPINASFDKLMQEIHKVDTNSNYFIDEAELFPGNNSHTYLKSLDIILDQEVIKFLSHLKSKMKPEMFKNLQ
ncbi:Uncharacterised protein r2_g383 [Pycnogonum litorale]